ncbi:hypothetical protein FRZ06_09490 [Anoxybacterium hadale]|uniref:Uncharacterized protein n=1 Tax=Anoxybacterium hadale TaxID=3408580 RepID=A0ACD1AB67_9FIRM|nr:hypothetical protein FRZ06_09490 [Clostridiales bacterium]
MKQQRISDAGLLAARDCLGHTCGTNFDTDDIEFASQQNYLTYLDKVFSFNKDTASPILYNLNTGGRNSRRFKTELLLDGCSVIPCTLSSNAVFNIENAFVVVEYFNTKPPGNINASQVTLDGFPVDSLQYSNGQYTARTANVLPRVQKERCLNAGLPTKAFFLITNVGPWDLRATYVLEGTVNTNGRLCRFRLEISNAPNSPNTTLQHNCPSNFSVRKLSLPCAINGTAPEILFQFSAKISLINPEIYVTCGRPQMMLEDDEFEGERHGCWPCPDVDPCNENVLNVALVTNVAVEPTLYVQTVRRTLFCLNACEALQPCQGSLVAAEIEEDEEDCDDVNPNPCRCGRGGNIGGTGSCRPPRPNTDRLGCNTQQIPATGGAVTIGPGNCNDCVWGNDLVPCRSCGGRDSVAGISDCRGGVAGIGSGCGRVGGASDRGKVRSAFQFNGTNGCSW